MMHSSGPAKLPIDLATAVRIEKLLGTQIRDARKIMTGYSATERWVIELEPSARYFAKIGLTAPSLDAIRHEAWVYERLRLKCMPRIAAWQDHETRPILILEDLSDLNWPPPWSDRTISMALAVIEQVHASSGPLPSYEERHGADWDWWRAIERNPEPFLRLKAASPKWLRSSLPALTKWAGSVTPLGQAVAHYDLRSDNFCFSEDEGRLLDWSLACLGNPKLDLGLFLPGLAAEHGPRPEKVLPNEPGIAAWVAGFFAWHASKPFIPMAPRVREMQLKLLRAALPWAVKELDLWDIKEP